MTHRQSIILAILVAVAVAVMPGCTQSEPDPAERAAVEAAVNGYLHALARSYSSLNLSHLDGHASPVEKRNVRNLLQELANSGDRVEATLIGLEVTGVDIFRNVNASVGLVEVWDIVRFDALNGREKGRTSGSVQTTLIQLRKIEGDWQVIGRHIVERETGSNLDDGGGEA